jgi:hypothetical protein
MLPVPKATVPMSSRCRSWAKRSTAMVVEDTNTTASDQK